MSIEYRAGRRYYYRVERVNGKLKKTYVGGGITGEVAAREMQQKAALRQQEIAERNEFNNQLWSLKRIHRLADTIAREAYYAAHLLAGYEQTCSYKWRKIKTWEISKARSKMKDDESKRDGQCENEKQVRRVTPHDYELVETIKAVRDGRQDLRPKLRSLLSEKPERLRRMSDTTTLAINEWSRHLSHGDCLVRDAIVLKACAHRDELMSRATNCMERVLVDRVVLTALQLEFFELRASILGLDEDKSRIGKAIQEGLKSANHQYDHAIRQLSRVEELRSELPPRKDAMAAAQLRVYDPEGKRKCG